MRDYKFNALTFSKVECHPYLIQKSLSHLCKNSNIVLTAYSPFASPDRPWADPKDPKLLDDPALLKIAIKHKKSVAQVLLRYQVINGYNFTIKC